MSIDRSVRELFLENPRGTAAPPVPARLNLIYNRRWGRVPRHLLCFVTMHALSPFTAERTGGYFMCYITRCIASRVTLVATQGNESFVEFFVGMCSEGWAALAGLYHCFGSMMKEQYTYLCCVWGFELLHSPPPHYICILES